MSECVNWPVLLAVIAAALSLFVIVLLSGCFLMRRLDARSCANADRLPVLTVEHRARPTDDVQEYGTLPPLKIALKRSSATPRLMTARLACPVERRQR
jgi:hypothetical protein